MDAPSLQYGRTDDGDNVVFATTGQGPSPIDLPGRLRQAGRIWQSDIGAARPLCVAAHNLDVKQWPSSLRDQTQ